MITGMYDACCFLLSEYSRSDTGTEHGSVIRYGEVQVQVQVEVQLQFSLHTITLAKIYF